MVMNLLCDILPYIHLYNLSNFSMSLLVLGDANYGVMFDLNKTSLSKLL